MIGSELELLYRDEHLLIVNKPSGLLVHRGLGRDRVTLVDLLRSDLHLDTVHVVHRLDRGTSGPLAVALSRDAARRAGESFLAGDVTKVYVALVRGRFTLTADVDHPVPRCEGGERVPASTSFRPIEVVDAEPRTLSLVEARPRTGRFHQIRRHLKHLSHPIIGDSNYGKGPLNREIRDRYGLTRLALHARSLELPHPVTGAAVTVEAPLPLDLLEPLERIGFKRGRSQRRR